MNEDKEISLAWLDAIHEATHCLRSQDRGDAQMAESALVYLNELERILDKKEDLWDRPPKKLPPPFVHQHSNDQTRPSLQRAFQHEHMQAPPVNHNRFSMFRNDESSSEEESESDVSEDEAGDQPFLHSMVMRRLMIRIETCQSELFAHMSNACRNVRPIPMWKEGSEYCVLAVNKIHQALFLADSEISRWIDNNIYSLARSELIDDATIVEVAIQHLTEESDRFQQAAQQQRQRLERRLTPQWTSRDTVKGQWGDRWYSNPAPKQDFARKRQLDEQQLREIEMALAQMQELDTEGLQISTNELRNRLLGSSPTKQTHRYNGLRPTDLSNRKSWQNYPDPTEFGWVFVGSENNKVEFFEKDGVKLDWYFTTGTIKTSLDHPKQGRTQLFAAGEQVSPEVYRQILENPRVHTNLRYQTQKGKHGRSPKKNKKRAN